MDKWSLKPAIYTGENCLSRLEQFEQEKICLVCDPYFIGTENFDRVMQQFAKSVQIEIFSEIIPDPPIETVALGVEKMCEMSPTIVIAIGGGSAIDTAKAMLMVYQKTTTNEIKKFIAIPTTSGTGSEVTSVTVITDTKKKIKYPIFHPDLIPDEALLEATFVTSCPPNITAYSGMDALTHAMEAMVATKSTTYTDALAEKVIRLVFENLKTCYAEGDNLFARSKMHEASCLAGIAFDLAGLGICHSIAHQVGANFKVPHGLANLMLLPHVIEANAQEECAMKKYAQLSRNLGFARENLPDTLAISKLKKEITQLSKQLHCPLTLKEFGIKEKIASERAVEISRNAKNDATYPSNPIHFSEIELERVYRKIIK
ncbi:1-propanol dehydrogenase [Pilibacter termitis]|uniref:1-propanol dehydrogenase n=1 Tax=Pilibacter termitis TaxID=263852 RepID=A0A1T4MJV6_9ENTE|nr:1-propanol dehydrogenase PduQ [Pilibacter termitis]SJZ67126.1 1-propanol dehydrogenase [Pilibacter termitis]